MGVAPRPIDPERALRAGRASVDVFETVEDPEGRAIRISAAIYFSGSPGATEVSSWHDVEHPGDESSYDSALAAAVSESESLLIETLARRGLDKGEAIDLVEEQLDRSDMPTA